MSKQEGQLRMDTCRVCGNSMRDGRKDMQTCGDNCRKKLSRKRMAQRKKMHAARSYLNDIREMLFDRETYDEAMSALMAIRDFADVTYARGLRQQDLAK